MPWRERLCLKKNFEIGSENRWEDLVGCVVWVSALVLVEGWPAEPSLGLVSVWPGSGLVCEGRYCSMSVLQRNSDTEEHCR